MANNLADYAENKLLDHVTGRASYTAPTAYCALFTAAPSDSGGGTEVSGGSYARVTTSGKWAAAASGSIATNADIDFGTASANWGTITHVALIDSSTSGGSNNYLWWGALTASKTVNSGDSFKIPSGSLTLALD